MPKPQLAEPYTTLERELIETFMAGHHLYRPDLHYPESHSDMQGGIRGILKMFKIERRPLAIELPIKDN